VKSPNLVDKHVSSRVGSRRIALGMSPEQMAAAVGSTVQQVQKWEAGTDRIGANQLLKLTKILGVNSAFFFADENQSVPDIDARSKEMLPSRSVLYLSPTLDGLRLTRAFTSIKNRALREIVIKFVETIAEIESDANQKLDGA